MNNMLFPYPHDALRTRANIIHHGLKRGSSMASQRLECFLEVDFPLLEPYPFKCFRSGHQLAVQIRRIPTAREPRDHRPELLRHRQPSANAAESAQGVVREQHLEWMNRPHPTAADLTGTFCTKWKEREST